MIDTNFRPLTLNKNTIFKHSSEVLAKEKSKCIVFTTRTFDIEVSSLEAIITKQELSTQRLKNDIAYLGVMKAFAEKNIDIVESSIKAVVKAEELRDTKRSARKNRKKVVKNLDEEEQYLLQCLCDIRKQRGLTV